MNDPDKLLEFFADLVPEHERAQFKERILRTTLSMHRVEEVRTKRIDPGWSRCMAAFERRFGTVPDDLRRDLAAMEPEMQRAAEDLIRRSADKKSFWESYDLFKSACGAGKVLGARQLLVMLLKRKFGRLQFGQEELVWYVGEYDLNACFERLLDAASADEVLAPLMRRLEMEPA